MPKKNISALRSRINTASVDDIPFGKTITVPLDSPTLKETYRI
jgi:hypothetical protein